MEDNLADIFLIREAIACAKLEAELEVIRDGHRASDFIDEVIGGVSPCPDIVLLDLNLPKRSGEEVLAKMRASARCAATPVLIITSSDSAEDRRSTRALGAAAFFRKASDYDEFMRLGSIVKGLLGL